MKTGTKSYKLALALIFITNQLACDRILPMKMKLSGRQKSFEMRSEQLRKTRDPLLLGPFSDPIRTMQTLGWTMVIPSW